MATFSPEAREHHEVARRAFETPVARVCAMLETFVEQDGRKILGRAGGDRWLEVAYPFSWTQNNWSGSMTFECEPVGERTVVVVRGPRRDRHYVLKVANEVFGGLDRGVR